MLVIRLLRIGKKNQPSFKMVVTEKKSSPTKGTFIEQVGFWNPLTKEKNLEKERIEYWLSVGAKPSNTVYNMLVEDEIIKGEKRKKHGKLKKKKEEEGKEAPKEEVKEKVKEEEKKAEKKPEEKEEDKKDKEAEKKPEEKEEKDKEKEAEKKPEETKEENSENKKE